MVKPRPPAAPSKPWKNLLKWWRALLGALLTFFIVVPYMMGADVEKYSRGWMDAINQRKGKLHLELLNYHRHWFSSEGDLLITGSPLGKMIRLHFQAYHGPLIFNAEHRPRLGLSYFKGSIDSQALINQLSAINLAGLIQVTAFVPYFSDRELHLFLPSLTIADKENKLIYRFNTVDGNLDGDGLLQMALPSLIISHENGEPAADLEAGLLRIQPNNHNASLSVKQIHIYSEKNSPAMISNLLAQANIQANTPLADKLTLNLALQFDQFKKPFDNRSVSLLEMGPFELKLKVKGLHSEGFIIAANTMKTLATQSQDLTPEQGEAVEKGLASIFTPETFFNINSQLSAFQGKITAEFQGGLKFKAGHTSWETSTDLFDAFYSKGSINLTEDVMKTLSEYAMKQNQPRMDPENLSQADVATLPLILGFLKQNARDYSTTIDIHDGRIILNGKEASRA